jgi:hypothetical protein
MLPGFSLHNCGSAPWAVEPVVRERLKAGF